VVARQGGVEVRERLALGPGEVAKRTLSGAAGHLSLAIKPPPFGSPGELVGYRIERIDAPSEVITTSRPTPVVVLAPGHYRVEGSYGAMNVRAMREIDVKSGQAQQLTLEPQAAQVKLRLSALAVGAASEVFWEIRAEDGRTVWTTEQPEAVATLQAGRYLIVAEARDRSYSRKIELRAGEARAVELAD
jgi:hypothetical protein